MKATYVYWLSIYKNFPKVERMGIGNKIEQQFLSLIETTFCLSYISKEHKMPFINKAITQLDIVKFFAQLSWEHKLFDTGKYSILSTQLTEIGRQLGGWKKGLTTQTKTPNQ